MIDAISARHADCNSILEEVLRLRHRTFVQRLGWDVPTDGEFERDEFDHADAWYLILSGDRGEVAGTCRLIPTTSSYMLAGPFRGLLEDRPPPSSAGVWECSRLAVDFDGGARGASLVRSLTAQIYCGIVEFGLSVGMKELLAVYDPIVGRFLRHIGCNPAWEGPARNCGQCLALAASFRIDIPLLLSIRSRCGVQGPVLRSAQSVAARTAA